MKRPLIVAIITLLALLLSQGYWLYNVYQADRSDMKAIVESRFETAIKLEMSARMTKKSFKNPNNAKWIIKSADEMTSEERARLKGDTITLSEAKERGLKGNFVDMMSQRIQDGLYNANRPLKLTVVDSIYKKLLSQQQLKASVQTVMYDSSRQPIHIIGSSKKWMFDRFETKMIPIGTRGLQYVRAYVTLPPSKIIKDLFYSLAITFLILMLSSASLFYFIKAIGKAHARLRERELSVHSAIHDLKAPLNTAYASIDFIAIQEKDPVKANVLNMGKSQIKRLTEIIESMLSLLKTSDGKQIINKTPIDIKPFIERSYQTTAQQYPDKHCVFQIKQTEDFPEVVNVDSLRLERCLGNLMENALKYSDDKVQITVVLSINNGWIQISVKDTGWGISKKDLKKIGRPFFRINHSDKPKLPGYGLGLSSVNLLVKEMKGVMSIQSKEGEGSAFCINLPIQ